MKLMAALDNHPKEAVVYSVQAFIGLEMAENLAKRGLQVTIVEKAPHVLPPLDQEMAAFVQAELVKNSVRVITSQSAVRFEDQGNIIVLENGQKIASDLTILSVGVEPENGLAKVAGIELGLRGGILVDEHYETSQKIFLQLGMPSSSSKRLQAKMLSSLSLLLPIVRDAKWQTSSQD